MMPVLDVLKEASLWAAVIAASTPLAFGVLGALFCARAGVLNFGIEGIFIAGAFAGAVAIQLGGGPWDGVIAAAAVGMALGALHGMMTGPLGVSQPLAGIALTLLAASLAQAGARMLIAGPPGSARSAPFAPIALPASAELPAAVATLLQQTPLTYLAILLALFVAYVLKRTPLGLALRACGDNPAAVEAQGRSVHGLRLGAIMAGSAMMAVGGAGLTLAAANAFTVDMVSGRGFVCLALAAAVGWRPLLAVVAVLPFGAIEAALPHLPKEIAGRVPADLLLVLPHVLAIIALAAAGWRARQPATLGVR